MKIITIKTDQNCLLVDKVILSKMVHDVCTSTEIHFISYIKRQVIVINTVYGL